MKKKFQRMLKINKIYMMFKKSNFIQLLEIGIRFSKSTN